MLCGNNYPASLLDLRSLPLLKLLSLSGLEGSLVIVALSVICVHLENFRMANVFAQASFERMPNLTGCSSLQHLTMSIRPIAGLENGDTRILVLAAAKLPPRRVLVSIEHGGGKVFVEKGLRVQYVREVDWRKHPDTLVVV